MTDGARLRLVSDVPREAVILQRCERCDAAVPVACGGFRSWRAESRAVWGLVGFFAPGEMFLCGECYAWSVGCEEATD